MKYLFFSLTLLLAGLCTQAQMLPGKVPGISPFTRIYLAEAGRSGADGAPVSGYVYKQYQGQRYISALVKVTPDFRPEDLQATGALAGTAAGDILTVQIPVQRVVAFLQTRGLLYVQLDEPLQHMALDSARRVTRADSVHEGMDLNLPLSGKDVVTGIIDAGFDYDHPVFRDTVGTDYRIKRIWAQKAGSGTPPSGFIYGAELTDPSLMQAAVTDNGGQSHGTHVAGIMAGSGYGSPGNSRYRGLAPAADIVMVGIMPDQQQFINTGGSDIIDGMDYIFRYATTVGKPAVVNLSWISALGPHDGSSLFSQAVENLTGAGKIFVNSAGNAGNQPLHLAKTFSATDSLVHTFPSYDASGGKTWVDIWGDTGASFCVSVTRYHAGTAVASTDFVCLDDTLHRFTLTGAGTDTCFVDITGTASEFNRKSRAFISLYNKSADSIYVSVKAISGKVDMWNNYVQSPVVYYGGFTNGGKSWATGGDTRQTISDNASGKSTIAAGAWGAKLSWKTINNTTYNYTGTRGDLAGFSSKGPAQDGRIKPDITAPGMGVVSAVNSSDPAYLPGGGSYAASVIAKYHEASRNRDYYFAITAGTSMSSPVVSGIVALMLEANPSLTPAQVQDILARTALTDGFTGTVPNSDWGAGKINAYQAVRAALQSNAVGSVVAPEGPACKLFPNPNNGQFQVGYLAAQREQIRLTVTDVAGRGLFADSWAAEAGYSMWTINRHFLPGIYIVHIASPGGSTALRMCVE